MEFFREYALLVALASPILVIVAMQVYLFAAGERGTLLLPSLERYASIAIQVAARPEAPVEALPPKKVRAANSDNGAVERIAA